MTKNKRIKALEKIIIRLGLELGFNITTHTDGTFDIDYQLWNRPIRGWQDLKIQALLKHLGIVNICRKEQLPEEYEVILIQKEKK